MAENLEFDLEFENNEIDFEAKFDEYGTAIIGSKVEVDDTPTADSGNAVSSGGVYNALLEKVDKQDPVSYGSFSHNRLEGSEIGEYSVALGQEGVASGKWSTAMGYATTASGLASKATGYATTASGSFSTAEGTRTIATKNNTHAEGDTTEATANNAHAEGYKTKATKNQAHAEGAYSEANGLYSHAEGYQTRANSPYQHTEGKFNIEDSSSQYLHIIGNGTADDNRSNAHTLSTEGEGWFAKDVYVGSNSGTNKDEGSKRLATEEQVYSRQIALTTDTSLTLTDSGKLSVNIANDFDGDNTLPISASAVQTTVGNIEILLKTI